MVSHSPDPCLAKRRTFCCTLLHFSLTLSEVSGLGCSGQLSLSSIQSGPSNHSQASILSSKAPRLHRSARFMSVGQYFRVILKSLKISAIFLSRFEKKASHGLAGLHIQYNPVILSIYILVDSMSQRCKAVSMFFTMFAAMCPLISPSLGIVILRFDICNFNVKNPCPFLINVQIQYGYRALKTLSCLHQQARVE